MFYGRDIARKAISKLMKEKSPALRDSKIIDKKRLSVKLSEGSEMTPAEITALTKRIKSKRLTSPGLSEDETQSLLKRIGLNTNRR